MKHLNILRGDKKTLISKIKQFWFNKVLPQNEEKLDKLIHRSFIALAILAFILGVSTGFQLRDRQLNRFKTGEIHSFHLDRYKFIIHRKINETRLEQKYRNHEFADNLAGYTTYKHDIHIETGNATVTQVYRTCVHEYSHLNNPYKNHSWINQHETTYNPTCIRAMYLLGRANQGKLRTKNFS